MSTHAKKWLAGGLGVLALGALYLGQAAPEAAPVPQHSPINFAFVRSMEGTRPDGDIKVRADDELVVDAELGHLFDYYLAGQGERELGAIRTEIEHELERRLKPRAAGQAKRLLANYLDYKRALVDVKLNLPKTSDMAQMARARLVAMQALRPQYFSEVEVRGLFGLSDAYDADAIARLEIGADKTLGSAERAAKTAALDAKLAPELRAEREAPLKVVHLEESVLKMRAEGATDDAVYRARAAAFSPDAAARLADVDREEAAWHARIAAYQAQRGKLIAEAAPASALQQLRDAQFNTDEQRRLGAYE